MALTPLFEVKVNGQDISSYLLNLMENGRLCSITVTDGRDSKSDAVDIAIARDGTMAPPPDGALIEVAFGYVETGLGQRWQFKADEPATRTNKNSGRMIEISGTAADMGSTVKAERHESNTEIKVGDLVSKVASRNGLTPVISESLKNIKLPQVDQTAENDMHLLRRLAHDLFATFKTGEGRLFFLDQNAGASASGAALDVITIPPGIIISGNWRGSKRDVYESVKASWHDQGEAKRVFETAGSGDPARTLKRVYPDKDQAKRAAESALKKAKASGEKATIAVPGNTLIRAERKLEIPVGAFEPEYAGSWIVETARHRCSTTDGYISEPDLEREA